MRMNSRIAVAGSALTTAVAFGLAGCGSSGAAAENQPSGGGFGGQGRMPGTSGQIAAISGSTLQVQSSEAQTAVTYTATTEFSQAKQISLAEVKVGDCVFVNGAEESGAVTARSVQVSAPVDGSCTANRGPGGMGGPGGGQPPNGGQAPNGGQPPQGGTPPEGAPSGVPGGGTFASGKVTSKSASGLVISGFVMSRGQGAAPSESPSETNVTVNVAGDTTYQTEAKATSADLKVGLCVRAMGSADDKGTVTATSINISQPVDGSCSFGFGGRRSGSGTSSN